MGVAGGRLTPSAFGPAFANNGRAFDDLDERVGGPMGGAAMGGRATPTLDERARSDWRRISVPERGKDFKSLPRKYNR
jgi:hypothetical protein